MKKVGSLLSAQVIFSKINAVLQTTKTFIVCPEQTKSALSYETTKGYRAYQLEAEHLKAKAEEFAQNIRQRFI